MNENKKIELTERMVEDALRAAREQGWDDAAEWGYRSANLGHYASERIKAANPHRPARELPTEDGAVIVPAEGCAHIETNEGVAKALVHLGGKWYGGAFQIKSEQIIPGTWKKADR